MRRFTIVHLSDLHLTGSSGESTDVLFAGVKSAIKDSATPVIFLFTGDLVEKPTRESIAAAKATVQKFEQMGDHVFIIPGNHDVKQNFGSFSRDEQFNDAFDTGKDLLIRDIGLHLIGLDSTSASFARGAVKPAEYDKFVRQFYDSEETAPDLPSQERAGLLRVVAVHHHPLPLADGEGQKVLGLLKDEGLMYLESPAQMLDACIDCRVSLILHGHRHVQGLVRYSVPSSKVLTSNTYLGTQDDESWDTVYVLSCPSSTGRGCDAAFNVLAFESSSDGAFVDVGRYSRTRNQGAFSLIDDKRPSRNIRLLFSRQLVRDIAVDVEAALSGFPSVNAPETEMFPIAARLFRRRAFMTMPERHWGQLFYATMKTRLVWQNEVLGRLRTARQKAGMDVARTLNELEEFVAYKVLKLTSSEPDELRASFIQDKSAFLQRLPISSVDDEQSVEVSRSQLLAKLQKQLASCGVPTDSFGQVPWDAPSGE
jgi:3',5'-cyclic AMP phosphodiesterase CpdA